SNVVLGGAVNDAITLGNGTNLVFGDAGYIDWAPDGGIHLAVSTSWTIGGDDTIVLGNGSNLVVGGAGSDNISGGTGFNVIAGDDGIAAVTGCTETAGVVGDTGSAEAAPAHSRRFRDLPITIGVVKTTDPTDGGNDTITTGSVSDIILGGPGDDTITTGGGTN